MCFSLCLALWHTIRRKNNNNYNVGDKDPTSDILLVGGPLEYRIRIRSPMTPKVHCGLSVQR